MRALIVEDDPGLGDFLSRVLEEEGHVVTLSATLADARSQVALGNSDIVLLDWMLPDGDGVSLCTEMREARNATPILMLTARAEIADRVHGLRAGADDYLVKPFELEELLARIDALIRRCRMLSQLVVIGEVSLDPIARTVSIRDECLELTSKEYGLLLRLATAPNCVVDRATLLADIWNLKFDPQSGILDVHMSRLRDKLGDCAWMIETVRGSGYRLRTTRAT